MLSLVQNYYPIVSRLDSVERLQDWSIGPLFVSETLAASKLYFASQKTVVQPGRPGSRFVGHQLPEEEGAD